MSPIKNEKMFFRFLIFGAFLCLLYGCSAPIAALRRVNEAPLDKHFRVHSPEGPKNSERTIRTLRMFDLEHSQEESLRGLLKIQKKLNEELTPDLLASYVEVAYCEAARLEKKDPALAAEIFASVAVYSYCYLFDSEFERERKFYDSQLRDVCLFYNGAVEKILAMMLDKDRNLHLEPGQEFFLEKNESHWSFKVDLISGNWTKEEIDCFKFSSDYQIIGMENEYRQEGLGVPLTARRKAAGSKKEEKYYPQGLCFPVTAFLRPLYRQKANGQFETDAVLELYDPLITPVTQVKGKPVPLETDLTTPLVYYMSDPKMKIMNSVGMFKPEILLQQDPTQSRAVKGLYMIQPYDPDKIPVVMVHGLWSSPMTWIEMFNTLRSIEEIRNKYQFWFYFYPSAQPFWISAAQLREDLEEIRNCLDPDHLEPALDEMILIGHSMGGLLSRMQVASSGTNFWDLISDTPFSKAKMDPKMKEEIGKWFFFEPNPSVRRVITIATPFQGSEAANDLTKWFAHRLISLPDHYRSILTDLIKTKPDWVKDDRLLKVKTSVDSLTPDCPAFKALKKCYVSKDVALNNINGLINENSKLISGKKGDGVVSFESSSQTGLESQKTISEDHMLIHTHPAAILEIRRILTEHLYQMEVEQRAKSTKIANSGEKRNSF